MALLLLVPDTPRWLVMKGRQAKALEILQRLGSHAEARSTVAEIEGSLRVGSSQAAPRLFAFGSLVIVAGIMLSVFQQFVGINAVLYYAPLMFKNMGASTDSALWQTIIVGLANVIFTVVAILTVDRLGRRPLLIIGALVMGVAMIALGFLFQAKAVGVGALVAVVALHRRLRALVGAGDMGAAVGDVSERHQEPCTGDCRGGAMDCQSVRLLDLQDPRRKLGPQRGLQSWICRTGFTAS